MEPPVRSLWELARVAGYVARASCSQLIWAGNGDVFEPLHLKAVIKLEWNQYLEWNPKFDGTPP